MKKFIIIGLCSFGVVFLGIRYMQHKENERIRDAKWEKVRDAQRAKESRLIAIDTLPKWREQSYHDQKEILRMYLVKYLPPLHAFSGHDLDGYIPALQLCLEGDLPQFHSAMPIEKAISWVAWSGCNGSIKPISELSTSIGVAN